MVLTRVAAGGRRCWCSHSAGGQETPLRRPARVAVQTRAGRGLPRPAAGLRRRGVRHHRDPRPQRAVHDRPGARLRPRRRPAHRAGQPTGLLVVMVLVALGLGAVVAESLLVFTAVKLVGAAYMCWLGVQALRHRRAIHVDGPGRPPGDAGAPRRAPGVRGRRLQPQGVHDVRRRAAPVRRPRRQGDVTAQMLVLGLLAFVIGLLSDGVWAVLASRLRTWFNGSPGARAGARHRRRGLDDRPRPGAARRHRPPGVAEELVPRVQPSAAGPRLGSVAVSLRSNEPRWRKDGEEVTVACAVMTATATRGMAGMAGMTRRAIGTPSSRATWLLASRACCARRTSSPVTGTPPRTSCRPRSRSST